MRATLRLFLVIPLAGGLTASPASSDPGPWPPFLSNVPDMLTLTPDGSFPFVVTVQGQGGPIEGALVEVRVGALNDDLVAYCAGQMRSGPSPGDGSYLVAEGVTDPFGEATFFVSGGGCIPSETLGDNWVVEVRADGIVLDNIFVNSPDIVNSAGLRPVEAGQDPCEPQGGGGLASVGLSDAVSHTGNIALGLEDSCSKMTAPFGDPVALADGVILTDYITAGTTCICQ